VANASNIPPSAIDEARGQLDRVRGEWLSRSAVTGVDVGLRRAGDGLAIRVYVDPDKAESTEAAFPERLGRFPVEVIEARFEPQQ
jgi:hypothetical protein